MAIKCDCCDADLTPGNALTGEISRHLVELNGGKKIFCDDCWIALGEYACSEEHKQKAKEKNF
jgi:hypothetical protein